MHKKYANSKYLNQYFKQGKIIIFTNNWGKFIIQVFIRTSFQNNISLTKI